MSIPSLQTSILLNNSKLGGYTDPGMPGEDRLFHGEKDPKKMLQSCLESIMGLPLRKEEAPFHRWIERLLNPEAPSGFSEVHLNPESLIQKVGLKNAFVLLKMGDLFASNLAQNDQENSIIFARPNVFQKPLADFLKAHPSFEKEDVQNLKFNSSELDSFKQELIDSEKLALERKVGLAALSTLGVASLGAALYGFSQIFTNDANTPEEQTKPSEKETATPKKETETPTNEAETLNAHIKEIFTGCDVDIAGGWNMEERFGLINVTSSEDSYDICPIPNAQLNPYCICPIQMEKPISYEDRMSANITTVAALTLVVAVGIILGCVLERVFSGESKPVAAQPLGVPPATQPPVVQPAAQPLGVPPATQPPVVQPATQPPVVQPAAQPLGVPPATQPPVVQPATQPPVVQPATQPPAVQPDAEPPAVPPAAQPPAVQPDAEPPAVPPAAQPLGVPPATQPPAVQPDAEPPAVPPAAQPLGVPPATQPPAVQPDAEPPAVRKMRAKKNRKLLPLPPLTEEEKEAQAKEKEDRAKLKKMEKDLRRKTKIDAEIRMNDEKRPGNVGKSPLTSSTDVEQLRQKAIDAERKTLGKLPSVDDKEPVGNEEGQRLVDLRAAELPAQSLQLEAGAPYDFPGDNT